MRTPAECYRDTCRERSRSWKPAALGYPQSIANLRPSRRSGEASIEDIMENAMRVPAGGLAQPAVNRNGGELADLLLRERQRDRVRINASNSAHRDRHLALAPQVASFENEVGDGVLAVDEEPVDVADVVAIG
jgi:hypothetical protein